MTTSLPTQRVPLKRLLVAGGLALVLAVIANGLVRALALAVLDISADFMPLQSPAFVPFTIVGVLGAVIAFGLIGRLSRQPVRTFSIVAVVVLLLSYLPDIGLLASGAPGATLPGILTLMVMHTIAAAISVWLLTRFGVER